MPASSDSAWVREAVARFEAPLLRYAARFTDDLDRARDVVQDTFLRLCAQPRADVDGHLAEWLFTVCRNRALDVVRKESRMNTTSTPLEGARSREPGPPAVMERNETVGRILQLLRTLPGKQQEVIRLKFQEGLSYKEISGVTQLTVSHVGVLIHTGLKTLRSRLDAAPRVAPGA